MAKSGSMTKTFPTGSMRVDNSTMQENGMEKPRFKGKMTSKASHTDVITSTEGVDTVDKLMK